MEETVPKSTCQDTLGPRSYSCSTNASAHLTDEETEAQGGDRVAQGGTAVRGWQGGRAPLLCFQRSFSTSVS